ncbi:right-handed parallel beta-helix repeat-containing protein [Filimonas effusa]|uniref:Right handed beta helix domain-containing protein n=1 Tax=Filimonas effusa TaxID=2508721 RepID=A0A4Q1DD72_9BACT|nr:right-handed parallel beta-helix repeat-containing protein [Filimonas effusa]RXK87340.1 hypothetical protein ESB13_11340 [Filimonas effusa]
MKKIFKSIVFALSLLWSPVVFIYAQDISTCYISGFGNDNNPGTMQKPFRTLNKALQFVKKSALDGIANQKIIIRKGIYYLNRPLRFDSSFMLSALKALSIEAYPGEKVIISGGQALPKAWKRIKGTSIWELQLSGLNYSGTPVLSLFRDNQRLERAGSDTLLSTAPLPELNNSMKVYDFQRKAKLQNDSINIFCGFRYGGDLFAGIQDISNVNVVVYNSWEASWHTIRDIDKKNKIMLLKNPMTYPVGFFNGNVRFRLENSKAYLRKAGQWVWEHNQKKVYYLARPGENPNQSNFIIPILDTLVSAEGEHTRYSKVGVTFSNITFCHSRPAWGKFSIPDSIIAKSKLRYPWLDYETGFASGQGALNCGQAINLFGAQGWVFESCVFSDLGGYAIKIDNYSRYNKIKNCLFVDNGGGGVIIGNSLIAGMVYKGDYPPAIPCYNVIENCSITRSGVLFPASVGIIILQAYHNTIVHNEISYLPYSGISCGWTWNLNANFTSFNKINKNHIHHVVRQLADGGGIYTLGRQIGSQYIGNYIHHIYKPKNSLGADNNGFFFDQGSSSFSVEGNAVCAIEKQDYRFNDSNADKIRLDSNFFEKEQQNKTLPRFVQKTVKSAGCTIGRSLSLH